jgi:hypothetical protein
MPGQDRTATANDEAGTATGRQRVAHFKWKDRMSDGPGSGESTASDGRVVQALILLLAACQQARHELDQADVVADGLREELNTLSVRLQDVLVQERRKSAT